MGLRNSAAPGGPLAGFRPPKRVWALAGAVLLTTSVAACSSGGSAASGSGSGPITIGVSVSLSGDFSSDGLATEQGYKTWAAYQNARGGILGRKIKLEFLSDGSSPTQVVTNYQKLITVDHVNYVLGPYSTLLTKPSAAIASRYGYVMIEAIGGGPSVFQQGLHNVFDPNVSASQGLTLFASWLASTQPHQKIAYAALTDPFLQPMTQTVHNYLDAHGFTTATFKIYPSETTDLSPIASALAATKANVVILGSAVTDGEVLLKDFIQDHYNPKMIVVVNGPDQGQQFVKAVGARNTEGIMYPDSWYPGATTPQNAQMVALYSKMFHVASASVSADVAEAFSAGQVLAQAVNHIKTLSNSKLEAYLHSGATFSTVLGRARFAPDGQNKLALGYMFQWQHSQVVAVLPAGRAGVKPIESSRPAWNSSR